MIKWQESYSIGVPKLDDQHKNLFMYFNDLEEGINNQVFNQKTLDNALKFLGSYVKGHFGQEETCMYKHVCPIADKNKEAHHKFIEAFNKFQKAVSENGDNETVLRDLHHFLETWLVEHICKIDVQLKPCVEKSH